MQSLKRIQNELAKCTFNIELVDESLSSMWISVYDMSETLLSGNQYANVLEITSF